MSIQIRAGAVCSGSALLASILNSSVMVGNYLQQTNSADEIFRCISFLGIFRVNYAALWKLYIFVPYIDTVSPTIYMALVNIDGAFL